MKGSNLPLVVKSNALKVIHRLGGFIYFWNLNLIKDISCVIKSANVFFCQGLKRLWYPFRVAIWSKKKFSPLFVTRGLDCNSDFLYFFVFLKKKYNRIKENYILPNNLLKNGCSVVVRPHLWYMKCKEGILQGYLGTCFYLSHFLLGTYKCVLGSTIHRHWNSESHSVSIFFKAEHVWTYFFFNKKASY